MKACSCRGDTNMKYGCRRLQTVTASQIITILILSLLHLDNASAQKMRDPGVKHWIGYAIVGPVNAPLLD
jgi:hypothetical protein